MRLPAGIRTILTQVGQSWKSAVVAGSRRHRDRRHNHGEVPPRRVGGGSAGGTIGCRAATLSGAFGFSATGGDAGGGAAGR